MTAYRRPHQLREALASVAEQDRSLIGEILIGDDSPAEEWPANRAVVAASELAPLIEYLPSDPPKGTYPNQWSLASRARHECLLLLHDDDQLCPGALATLAKLRAAEKDERVKIWFGRNLIMDEHGTVDAERSRRNNEQYGKLGPSESRPMWDWCLTESVPPNSFLVATQTYRRHMRGANDGNIGDWAFVVRLANGGAWGRFVAEDLSRYRVQAGSVTTAGRGADVHRWYAIAMQLVVPPEAAERKRQRFSPIAAVATTRYLRDGERGSAWKCFLSPDWSWRQRSSIRGFATLAMLLTPRIFWRWALRYRA